MNKIYSKPSDWVCKDFPLSNPPSNWNMNNFDDSSWKSPLSYGKNGDKNTIWFNVNRGSLSDLSSEAQWLWTPDYNNHDHVYCRMNQAQLKDRLTPSITPESKNYGINVVNKKLTDLIIKIKATFVFRKYILN